MVCRNEIPFKSVKGVSLHLHNGKIPEPPTHGFIPFVMQAHAVAYPFGGLPNVQNVVDLSAVLAFGGFQEQVYDVPYRQLLCFVLVVYAEGVVVPTHRCGYCLMCCLHA